MFMNKLSKTDKSRNSYRLCTYALMICAFIIAGCNQKQQKESTSLATVPDINEADAMTVAEDVLAQMYFSIDKADVSSGYIRTRPLSGAQFFEFWRSDNVGAENTLLSNLQTIRRTVELNINRRQDRFEIDCNVRVQSLSLPERENISSAEGYGMHTRSSPILQRMRLDAKQIKDTEWIDLGEDKKLAAEIVKRITKKIALRAGDKSPVMESRS